MMTRIYFLFIFLTFAYRLYKKYKSRFTSYVGNEHFSAQVCFQMIAKHFGHRIDFNRSLELVGYPENGYTSFEEITDAANKIGLQSSIIKLDYNQLINEISLPVILPWSKDFYVVLYSVDHKSIHIADPVKGKIKVPHTSALEQWGDEVGEGTVLFLEE